MSTGEVLLVYPEGHAKTITCKDVALRALIRSLLLVLFCTLPSTSLVLAGMTDMKFKLKELTC